MPASDDHVPPRRSRLERIFVRSWEYRHLRLLAGLRIGGGIALAILGIITLGVGGGTAQAAAWSLIFLLPAAASLAFGFWQVNIYYRLAMAPLPQRVQELEQSRAHVVDDAAARLRRIERDLHDGAQAQMVAVTMKLGLAVKKLGGLTGDARPGPVDHVDLDRADLDRILDLVVAAHRGAREAVAELRDLCRGIHPPVLDQGLEIALSTLAARCDLPVELVIDLPERPAAAIETIAYFCAAELLTNAAKHSGARQATLEAILAPGPLLRVRVTDDGRGGAQVEARGGLAGLAERIRTVDGRLVVSSPAGGPTVITVELPSRA
jgi:signal transduction histidine kinase